MAQFGLRSLFSLVLLTAILMGIGRLKGLVGLMLGFDAVVLFLIGREFLRGTIQTVPRPDRPLDLFVSGVLFVAALVFLLGALLVPPAANW